MDSDRTSPSLTEVQEAIARFLEDSDSSSLSQLFALVDDFLSSKQEKQQCCTELERFLQPVAFLRKGTEDKSLRLRHIQLQAYLRIWLYCCDDEDGTSKTRYAQRLATKKRLKAMSSEAILVADIHSTLTLAAFCLPREEPLSSFLNQVLLPLAESCPTAQRSSMKPLVERIFDLFEVPFLVADDGTVAGEIFWADTASSALPDVHQTCTGAAGGRIACQTARKSEEAPSRELMAQKEQASARIGLRAKRLIQQGNRSRCVGGRFHSNSSKKLIRQVEDSMSPEEHAHSLARTQAAAVSRFVASSDHPRVGVLRTIHNQLLVDGRPRPLSATEKTTPRKRTKVLVETPVPIKKAGPKADRSIR